MTAARRPMTEAERALARALARCRFPVGSTPKRFARQLGHELTHEALITERQAAYLRRLVSTYRRQIKPASIPEEERWLLTETAARAARAGRGATRWTARPAVTVPWWVVVLTGMATVEQIIAKWGEGAVFEHPEAKPDVPRPRAGRSVPPARAQEPGPADQIGLHLQGAQGTQHGEG